MLSVVYSDSFVRGFTWGFGKRNKNFIDYQGEEAFSEPEALALHLYVQRRPDLNGFVDFHWYVSINVDLFSVEVTLCFFHSCAKDVRAPGKID